MNQKDKHPILLFDGVCNLCNRFVQEVITRDQKGIIHFASLQSDIGQELLHRHGIDPTLDTVVLIDQGKAMVQSDVALQIFGYLGGTWSLLQVFFIVPKFIRDGVYDWIAKNRYRWFGKRETCMMPKPEWVERFLD